MSCLSLSLRSIVLAGLVVLQLTGCLAESTNSPAVQQMERNHEQTVLTMGSGGGGGM